MPKGLLLHPLPHLIERVTSELHDTERIHHLGSAWQMLFRRGLEPGEPVYCDGLDPVTPGLGSRSEPVAEDLLRPARSHTEQPGRPASLSDGDEIDDHGHILVATSGMPPHMLVHTDGRDPVESVRIIDQSLPPLSEDRGVRGMPRHSKIRGGTSNSEVIEHKCFERLLYPGARDLCPFRGGLTGVFAPDFPTVRAPVTTNPDVELGRTMSERFMREFPGNRFTGSAFGSTPTTPRIGLPHSAVNDHPVGLERLSDRFETEFVEAAERGQISGLEGSVVHVEVFRMERVRTSIIERPRSLSLLPLRTPRLDPMPLS